MVPMKLRGVSRALPAAVLLMLTGSICLVADRLNTADSADLRGVLRDTLQLSDADMAALLQGTPVAKTLTSTAPREMTTVGSIRIRGSAMDRFVDQFKTLEGFRTSQFVLQ